jgi:hypothetical protein
MGAEDLSYVTDVSSATASRSVVKTRATFRAPFREHSKPPALKKGGQQFLSKTANRDGLTKNGRWRYIVCDGRIQRHGQPLCRKNALNVSRAFSGRGVREKLGRAVPEAAVQRPAWKERPARQTMLPPGPPFFRLTGPAIFNICPNGCSLLK